MSFLAQFGGKIDVLLLGTEVNMSMPVPSLNKHHVQHTGKVAFGSIFKWRLLRLFFVLACNKIAFLNHPAAMVASLPDIPDREHWRQ